MPLVGTKIKPRKKDDLAWVSDNFNKEGLARTFENAGVMINGVYYTYKSVPDYHGKYMTLNDIVLTEKDGALRDLSLMTVVSFPTGAMLRFSILTIRSI